MQGKTIYGYTLQRQLGVGGMAEVWLAENEIGKLAAVKLLLPKFCSDDDVVARFKNEAKVMVKLDHPNIRQVYDYGSIDNRPCIVMEYLEGDDMKALMKSGRRFTEAELRKWWNQIADALNYTHEQGIVHRDIKPSNIFLDKKGNIKLLDFGIAKIRESISMTQTGAMMGTLMYMSPEQVEDSKHIGPESDVYSLAVSFVYLLTGKTPYDSSTLSDFKIRESIVYKSLDLSDVPAAWQSFLAPYLAKKPEDRPSLRPFTAASEAPVYTTEPDDEGTIVNEAPKKQEPPRQEPKKTEPQPTPKPNSNTPQSKKTLWIALAAAAVAALVAVLVMGLPKQRAHEYVDLGLPSGTLWATCNVGANNPEEYGDYYAWGETQTKDIYDWDNYKYANGGQDKLTKYCNNTNYGNGGFADNQTTLQESDDPATANWGRGWRTPSAGQWQELLDHTAYTWTTQNGVRGRLFTSISNGKTLFLPAAGNRLGSELSDAGSCGNYWSRSLGTDGPYYAWSFRFLSNGYYMNYSNNRSNGFTVRAVREK